MQAFIDLLKNRTFVIFIIGIMPHIPSAKKVGSN